MPRTSRQNFDSALRQETGPDVGEASESNDFAVDILPVNSFDKGFHLGIKWGGGNKGQATSFKWPLVCLLRLESVGVGEYVILENHSVSVPV
jgi:hypothetical protein